MARSVAADASGLRGKVASVITDVYEERDVWRSVEVNGIVDGDMGLKLVEMGDVGVDCMSEIAGPRLVEPEP